MKKAFTLAETVIVLAVIGVIATLLLRGLQDTQPDREKIMFKKAYQITERTVGEIVNDEAIYPYHSDKIGFYNKEKAYVEGTDTFFEGDEKFCQFFARKVNTYAPALWDDANKQCTFETTDGISWIVPSNFDNTVSPKISQVTLTVDINGNKFPNTKDSNDPHRDIFDIIVEFDGRVYVTGEKEIEFLKSHDPSRGK